MIVPIREFESSLDERELFYRLFDPEGYVDFVPHARDWIRTELSKLPGFEIDIPGLFEPSFGLDGSGYPSLEIPEDLDSAGCRILVCQFAPTALLGQCWLQSYSQAANCDQEVTAALFKAYQGTLNSKGHPSDLESYRTLMRRLGIDLPPIITRAFCRHDQLSDPAFRRALLGLCIARCAPEFTGELLGFTAADMLGLSGIFDQTLLERFKALDIPDDYQISRIRAGHSARPAVQKAIHAYLQSASDMAEAKRRVGDGLRLYGYADRSFWLDVLRNIRLKPSAAEKVLHLFRKKAPYGLGFHKSTRIGGIGLDEWFESGLEDGEAFLNAFADSDWFDIRNPGNSLFFTRLTSHDGVMVGVFTPFELHMIRDWLDARSTKKSDRVVSVIPKKDFAPVTLPDFGTKIFRKSGPKPSTRELFHRLVNIHDFPEILPAARSYLEKCLRNTKLALRVSSNPEVKTFPFSHAAFENRVHSIYRRQVNGYRPLYGKPRWSRETWAWIIEQFAPTVLVDGCWLQTANDPGMRSCPVSTPLWRIYADEVGNGEIRANHPLIYRHLLESLEIDLPPIEDPRFAEHEGFVAGAFDIPVYLLAISHFSRSFLPELIGVNLAIELSGLGGAYLRLAETFDYWGIDPTIVRVHQSADNMASGHSAIARDVVSRYLDEILSLSGEETMQNHWQRIWLGFASIRTVPLRFIASLIWHHLARSAIKRIRGYTDIRT